MSFENTGFLGKEAESMSMRIVDKHKKFFALCYDINRFAEKVKYKFDIHNQDDQELITACLFIRLLEGFQATIILASRGLVEDTKVVVRTLLESVFLLKVCCEDKSFLIDYIKSDEIIRLKWMNVADKSEWPFFNPLREYATPEIKTELEEKIRREGIKPIKIEDVAKKAELSAFYDAAYRWYSSSTHVSARSLENAYIGINENGDISHLLHRPDDREIEKHLLTVAECLLLALNSTCLLFGLKEDITVIEGLYDRLKRVAGSSG